ncbi:MAG: diaminopimelate decarboxylase [bacterium]
MHHFHWKHGQLFAENVALEKLARRHGTPLYVYSAQTILDHYGKLDAAFAPVDHLICYAVKANSNLAILSLLARKGAGFDIVSGGELYRVLKAGGKANRCTFAGVGKTREEIEFALREGIYCFIAESEAELLVINEVAARMKKRAPVAVRVNPNVDARTHAKVTTGTYANKFGVAFEEIPALYARLARLKNLRLLGVQVHIGSQITVLEPFVRAVKKMLPLVVQLREEHGIEFFDIGGGLGIVYQQALESGEKTWWQKKKTLPLAPQRYAGALLPLLKKLKGLRLVMEPGRFLVGNAGVLLTKILYVKKTGRKNFIIVDAAMNDLIRPALYDSYHEVVPLRQSKSRSRVAFDIVGPICETGDVFCKDRPLPPLKIGDLIAFMSVGAYGWTMASNYNSRLRVAEVLVKGAQARLIRRRETREDLIRGEIS